MQAVSYIRGVVPYNPDMAMGRPTTKPRTSLGERIAQARQLAGLTQQQLADKLRATQRVVAYWEREAVSLRADQLTGLAEALGVSADYFLGREEKKRGKGPVGKTRQVFEEVSTLPRHHQEQIVKVVSALVAQAKAS